MPLYYIIFSNPTGGMDICLLCVVRQRSLRRADHSPKVVLPTVARRCVIKEPRGRGGHSPHWAAEPVKKKYIFNIIILWDHRRICGQALTEMSLYGACVIFLENEGNSKNVWELLDSRPNS
jgi:hypothetical protein